MAKLGINAAFAEYGAVLKNPQWSVSAWTPSGDLVLSLWDHHFRKGAPPGMMDFADSFNRWSGHGNAEFRENVRKAYATGSRIRLVIVKTDQIERVQAGEDASKIRKEFFLREEMIGWVHELTDEHYVIRFRRK
ncbi:hypothetical protein SOM08_14430 [Hydrogenophaga sp. SNF1]|uniref:hypothetical protein n=1 Tax=Hydrogenophaga sp. SNF1 TaxID=3098762 RepID=UPI002ACC3411|nr:hypothetical protein [Hydrogenophaga sp. SNF1]WQB82194.1 hypothetical protein SOM08_14430 [Hydrogenophaga sp. SNF1]